MAPKESPPLLREIHLRKDAAVRAYTLNEHNYGESGIEYLLVHRNGEKTRIRKFRCDVKFLGGPPEAYQDGDNRRLFTTGTISNTVLALGAEHSDGEPEAYALALARRLTDAAPSVQATVVHLSAMEFTAIPGAAPGPARHFTGPPGGALQHTATVRLGRDADLHVFGGLDGLELFATSGATFTGFPRDFYTTTPHQPDRALGISCRIAWRYNRPSADYGKCRLNAYRAATRAFAEHTSNSSQHTFHHLARAVLDACQDTDSVRIEGIHQTRPLLDLGPFLPDQDVIYGVQDSQTSPVTVEVNRS
ncbi:hypothetical protein [Streptomyces sp. NPDC058992]|uniref:hypothetical protein n=1 Tax=unclassified Streptomyces TaxID=2593676 RepID=UPI0036A687B2